MKLTLPSSQELPQLPVLPQAPDNSVDVRGLVQIFLSRLWIIILAMVLCLGAGVGYLLKTPKLYAANAVLEAKSQAIGLNVINNGVTTEANALEEQHTFEQSLTNRTLLIGVARALNLDQDARLFPNRTAEKEATDSDLAKALAPRVQAELRRGTRLIDLKVTYFDAETAKLIADKVIELYVSQGASMESGASQKATSSLAMEAERLRLKLEESDKALQAFREQNSGVPIDAGYNQSLERTKELNSQFSKAKGLRLQLEADIARLDQLNNEPTKNLLLISSIATQADVQELNRTISGKEAELLAIREWCGRRHPRFTQAQKEIEYLIIARDESLKNGASRVRSTYEGALEAEVKLQAAIADQERISNELGKQTIPLAQLQNEVKTNRELYELVSKRVKETSLAATLAVANFRVTEAPIVQPDAVSPRKTQVLGLALIAGLIFGVGGAFGLEVFKPTASSPKADESTPPELPILAELPSTGYDPLTLAMDCANQRHTPECAAFRTLRSSLSFLRRDQESRSIVITSASEDGDASFCALNLAATYAGENLRTLLIVMDFKNHDLERILIDPSRGAVRGLSEGLANSLQPDGFCHATPIPNLYFIPAGRPVSDPAALLKSQNFRELMMLAWTSVDRIILCAPPVMEMQEPLVPLRYAEAVCLVAKSGRTSKAQISAAVSRLRFPGHSPAGLVMTGAPPRIMSGQTSLDPTSLLQAGANSRV